VEAVVVVTRWFGGTKLGTGGLARAYGDAAARALEAARTRRVRPAGIHHVAYGYADTGAVARVLTAAGVVRGADGSGADVAPAEDDGPGPPADPAAAERDDAPLAGVRTEVRVPRGGAAALDRALRDATAGRA